MNTNTKKYRKIVALIFIVYALLLMEGALRKWGAPQYHRYIFFIRDPFVLLIYILTFFYGLWPRSGVLVFGTLIAVAATILAAMQYSTLNYLPPVLVGYGWRNYFFYLPLPFIIGNCLGKKDLERITRYTLIFGVFAAVLCNFQSKAPATDPINQGLGQKESEQFRNLGTARGFVRAQGTFTSSLGQSMFIGSSLAILLYYWILPAHKRQISNFILVVATAAIIANIAVSGSRTAYFLGIILLLACCFCYKLTSTFPYSIRAIILPVFLGAIAITSIPIFFPEMFEATYERFAGAFQTEDVSSRFTMGLTNFINTLEVVPVLGYGLGSATNAATRLGISLPIVFESDWSRHLVDLGPFIGLVFIFFRVALVFWLGKWAITATRFSGNPLPILLFAFIAPTTLNGLITGNGTVHGYNWIFMGFCLAANHQALKESS